ncbi:MAG: hypothetical protein, partial [Olavius algarvensis Gamma 1 endosymbiont]
WETSPHSVSRNYLLTLCTMDFLCALALPISLHSRRRRRHDG